MLNIAKRHKAVHLILVWAVLVCVLKAWIEAAAIEYDSPGGGSHIYWLSQFIQIPVRVVADLLHSIGIEAHRGRAFVLLTCLLAALGCVAAVGVSTWKRSGSGSDSGVS